MVDDPIHINDKSLFRSDDFHILMHGSSMVLKMDSVNYKGPLFGFCQPYKVGIILLVQLYYN